MMMMMRRQPQPSQMVMTELEQSFRIVTVESSANELPADLDALMVVHPQGLSQKLQFAIDQFLLGGKPVFLALEPSSQHFKRQGGQQQMMMGGGAQNVTSDLPALLSAYELSYDAQKVAIQHQQHPVQVVADVLLRHCVLNQQQQSFKCFLLEFDFSGRRGRLGKFWKILRRQRLQSEAALAGFDQQAIILRFQSNISLLG